MTSNQKPKVIPVDTQRIARVVDPALTNRMLDYKVRVAAHMSGYETLTDWHPIIPEGWGNFPMAESNKSKVYLGNAQSWAYSHHQAVTKFGDKFVVSWSNGFLHEDYVGQEAHIAYSDDCVTWSKPDVVAATPVESRLVRNNAGLCATADTLYSFVGVAKDFGRDVSSPGMMTLKEQPITLDVHFTKDMKTWEHNPDVCPNVYLFEGPRKTQEGKWMCCGFDMVDHHAMVLIWDDDSKLAGPPRVKHIRKSSDGVEPEQGTWYQTDDGRIFMYQRDGSWSCRLGLTWSDDGGETWSELIRTDFPNTFSRAFAGRMTDGRFYIAGNNYDIPLDRRHMLLAVSEDGYVFDKQYVIVEGDTTRRIQGRHKEDGFHYPNCYADGDNLLMVYSINKEDIELAVIDTKSLK